MTRAEAESVRLSRGKRNPDTDDYVQDIFGNQYTVIDNVESLPEKLPQLIMALTK